MPNFLENTPRAFKGFSERAKLIFYDHKVKQANELNIFENITISKIVEVNLSYLFSSQEYVNCNTVFLKFGQAKFNLFELIPVSFESAMRYD